MSPISYLLPVQPEQEVLQFMEQPVQPVQLVHPPHSPVHPPLQPVHIPVQPSHPVFFSDAACAKIGEPAKTMAPNTGKAFVAAFLKNSLLD